MLLFNCAFSCHFADANKLLKSQISLKIKLFAYRPKNNFTKDQVDKTSVGCHVAIECSCN